MEEVVRAMGATADQQAIERACADRFKADPDLMEAMLRVRAAELVTDIAADLAGLPRCTPGKPETDATVRAIHVGADKARLEIVVGGQRISLKDTKTREALAEALGELGYVLEDDADAAP